MPMNKTELKSGISNNNDCIIQTETEPNDTIINNENSSCSKTENECQWNFGTKWFQLNENGDEILDISPKYGHVKEEVLNNTYSPIAKYKWNDILRKSHKICNFVMGSRERINFSKNLKSNNCGLKQIVILKLYTDDDDLQREFRKCYFSKFNQDKERLSSFYHWRNELKSSFTELSKIPYFINNQPKILYHGITCSVKRGIINKTGIYYGPLSTTTNMNVARDFAGPNGMILVIKPNESTYKVLDISLISDFPEEKEVLLFDHNITILDCIPSKKYDENSLHYQSLYDMNNNQLMPTDEMIKSLKDNVLKQNEVNEQHKIEDIVRIELNKQDVIIDNDEKEKNMNNMNNMNKMNNMNGDHPDDEHKNNVNEPNVNLLWLNSMRLLCTIYQIAQSYIIHSRVHQNYYDKIEHIPGMIEILKQFKCISVPKTLYNQFLNNLQIDSAHCDHVLSEYMRVL